MKCWRGGWKKSLINYRCCSHENIAIKDGDTIFSDIEGQEKGCSQIEVYGSMNYTSYDRKKNAYKGFVLPKITHLGWSILYS